MSFILGIAGGTGSGKSWLAQELARRLKSHATLIQTDWYYHDQSHVRGKAERLLNFDHPRAIEVALLAKHLSRLKQGEVVQAPQYNYATHARVKKTVTLHPRPILIVEGLFVLHERALRRCLDHTIFLDISADRRLIHRIRRDQVVRSIPVVETLRLYEEFARPMHDRYVQPSLRHAVEIWRDLPTPQRIASLATRLRRQTKRTSKRKKS